MEFVQRGPRYGAVTFRAPPQSCPISGGPCGATKGEFAINIGNEAADVSSVDGINAIMAMDLSEGGATPWPSNPSGGQVAENSGTIAGDKTAWGVFPYRCTQCAAIGDAPGTTCNPLGPAMQSYCKAGTEHDPAAGLPVESHRRRRHGEIHLQGRHGLGQGAVTGDSYDTGFEILSACHDVRADEDDPA
jgi:hypothetical protein